MSQCGSVGRFVWRAEVVPRPATRLDPRAWTACQVISALRDNVYVHLQTIQCPGETLLEIRVNSYRGYYNVTTIATIVLCAENRFLTLIDNLTDCGECCDWCFFSNARF